MDAAREKDAQHTLSLIDVTSPGGEPVIAECAVLHWAEDPASRILHELHGDLVSSKNLAEREAIAWALVHDTESIFVSSDKRAVLSALAELGRGRVAHPFDVWLDLLDRDWISSAQFDELCRVTHRHDQGLERLPARIRERLPKAPDEPIPQQPEENP